MFVCVLIIELAIAVLVNANDLTCCGELTPFDKSNIFAFWILDSQWQLLHDLRLKLENILNNILTDNEIVLTDDGIKMSNLKTGSHKEQNNFSVVNYALDGVIERGIF